MALYEFECPKCKERIERIVWGDIRKPFPRCQECNLAMKMVEFSVPARRNPEKGIQT